MFHSHCIVAEGHALRRGRNFGWNWHESDSFQCLTSKVDPEMLSHIDDIQKQLEACDVEVRLMQINRKMCVPAGIESWASESEQGTAGDGDAAKACVCHGTVFARDLISEGLASRTNRLRSSQPFQRKPWRLRLTVLGQRLVPRHVGNLVPVTPLTMALVPKASPCLQRRWAALCPRKTCRS